MRIPASAPSTPASNDPALLMGSGFPGSYSCVSSPKYQTLPARSWANQSNVSSTSTPLTSAVSCTTTHVTPSTILVLCVTTKVSVELSSLFSYTKVVPGLRVKYGLSMSVVNSPG